MTLAPPREQIARIFGREIAIPFGVRYWDGREDRFGAGEPLVWLVFRSPNGLARMLKGGLTFGEAYMDGDIEIEGETRRMFVILNALQPRLGLADLMRLFWFNLQLGARTSVASARDNVRHHYDLGNAFFQLWLDRNLTYSCGYFAESSFTLEQAQTAKVDHLCRKLLLQPGDRLLDIGCGWGALLLHAVEKYGVHGTGVTLSMDQASYAQAEIVRRGLEGRASVTLRDYRSIEGTFDKIVSVGMFEHVGKREMPLYFQRAYNLLKDGGVTVLHTIGRKGWLPPGLAEWTRRYIFPGGYLPEAEEIFASAAGTGLIPVDLENLKQHYAWTLDVWADRFEASLDEVRRLGFDDRFIRMWRYFLYGSAENFRTGVLQLYQVTFVKGLPEMPRSRQHLYRPADVSV